MRTISTTWNRRFDQNGSIVKWMTTTMMEEIVERASKNWFRWRCDWMSNGNHFQMSMLRSMQLLTFEWTISILPSTPLPPRFLSLLCDLFFRRWLIRNIVNVTTKPLCKTHAISEHFQFNEQTQRSIYVQSRARVRKFVGFFSPFCFFSLFRESFVIPLFSSL